MIARRVEIITAAGAVYQRQVGMTATKLIGTAAYVTTGILALGTGTVTVGSSCNAANVLYYYTVIG